MPSAAVQHVGIRELRLRMTPLSLCLAVRLQTMQLTSCPPPTPRLTCCPTRSKTSPPSSTSSTSAGNGLRDTATLRLDPLRSNASRPRPLFSSPPQRAAVEQTRGVLPVLGVSPEPRAHPPLHTKSARQRLLQAAVRHHESGQENPILPGAIFISRK